MPAEDGRFYARSIDVDHLISRREKQMRAYARHQPLAQIIKAEALPRELSRRVTVGGIPDHGSDDAPAIMIERNGDDISRIVVTCPCGRQAELLCEYPEDEGQPAEHQTEPTGMPEQAEE